MPFVIAFVLGTIIGSFLNVCVFRIPAKKSILFPASHCVSCKRAIFWHDNIPLLSFLVLKGRCRNCGCKISPQYPFVELLGGGLFVLFYAVFGLSAQGFVFLLLALILLVAGLIDYRHQIIPDEITLPGILAGLVLSFWTQGLLNAVLGMLLGGGILYLAGTIAQWILKKEAMGGGDVKLLAMIGAFLGWKAVLWTLFTGSFVGTGVGLYLRFVKKQERIPFGPCLALGAFLYLFFGESFFNWYLLVYSG
jgi:leader peptidase (prepilin peptidase)/N-methyltransferase